MNTYFLYLATILLLRCTFCCLQNINEGAGYWKFNNSLLENNNFLSEMENTINQIIFGFSEFDDPTINWEYLKFKMREVVRNRSTKLAKEHREKRTDLEYKVKKISSN